MSEGQNELWLVPHLIFTKNVLSITLTARGEKQLPALSVTLNEFWYYVLE